MLLSRRRNREPRILSKEGSTGEKSEKALRVIGAEKLLGKGTSPLARPLPKRVRSKAGKEGRERQRLRSAGRKSL